MSWHWHIATSTHVPLAWPEEVIWLHLISRRWDSILWLQWACIILRWGRNKDLLTRNQSTTEIIHSRCFLPLASIYPPLADEAVEGKLLTLFCAAGNMAELQPPMHQTPRSASLFFQSKVQVYCYQIERNIK